jgi:restriction endonuclease S subunit
MLDPWYFCYQFNEGREIQQQINRYSQGTVLSVKRLNVQMISDMLIHLPDINKQRQIGKLYQHSIRQHDLMCKQAENMKILTLAMIRKIEED